MVTKTEQEIVDLLKEGDKRAIPIIYENYSSALYGVILKITINEALAEDALQESIINLQDRLNAEKGNTEDLFELLQTKHQELEHIMQRKETLKTFLNYSKLSIKN